MLFATSLLLVVTVPVALAIWGGVVATRSPQPLPVERSAHTPPPTQERPGQLLGITLGALAVGAAGEIGRQLDQTWIGLVGALLVGTIACILGRWGDQRSRFAPGLALGIPVGWIAVPLVGLFVIELVRALT